MGSWQKRSLSAPFGTNPFREMLALDVVVAVAPAARHNGLH